jgi:hypothetical protein
MFVNGLGRNEQSLQRTFHRCFLPSFGSFGQAVSEEKIFKNQPNRNKNCLWQPYACLLMDRDEMSNRYRGSSIDAEGSQINKHRDAETLPFHSIVLRVHLLSLKSIFVEWYKMSCLLILFSSLSFLFITSLVICLVQTAVLNFVLWKYQLSHENWYSTNENENSIIHQTKVKYNYITSKNTSNKSKIKLYKKKLGLI